MDFTVTITASCEDVGSLWTAARAAYRLANSGRRHEVVDPEFEKAYGTVEAPRVQECARLVFDTGRDLQGVAVRDSTVMMHHEGGYGRYLGKRTGT